MFLIANLSRIKKNFCFRLAEIEIDSDATIVDLSNQNLNDEDLSILSNYPNLEIINLSDNNLEGTNADTFSENINLKELNLSNNQDLTLGDDDSFLKSDTIEKLSLANCGISEYPDEAFQHLPNLKELDLSGNDVNVIIKKKDI